MRRKTMLFVAISCFALLVVGYRIVSKISIDRRIAKAAKTIKDYNDDFSAKCSSEISDDRAVSEKCYSKGTYFSIYEDKFENLAKVRGRVASSSNGLITVDVQEFEDNAPAQDLHQVPGAIVLKYPLAEVPEEFLPVLRLDDTIIYRKNRGFARQYDGMIASDTRGIKYAYDSGGRAFEEKDLMPFTISMEDSCCRVNSSINSCLLVVSLGDKTIKLMPMESDTLEYQGNTYKILSLACSANTGQYYVPDFIDQFSYIIKRAELADSSPE
ncbi:MAG: hypothetical protein Q8Q08_09865 [Candidatus Omnitrophota bacterium]|nr:hypothetical protein [Candidatus Omnitrophota bacterium]